MTTELKTQTQGLQTLNPAIIEKLVTDGDLKGLSPIQRVEYYNYRCQQAGLDPAAKPFDLLSLNGKLVLYANAGATQQLTANRNLSHEITARELTDDIYCVFCRVRGSDGRSTENMGAVPVGGLKGEAKANAMLKATTKAIRRSVLAHCGLGMMDETETETIPGAVKLVEDDQIPEWSDEDRAAAKQLIFDLADALADKGVAEEAIHKIIEDRSKDIGDERGFDNWCNRLHNYAERCIAKAESGVKA